MLVFISVKVLRIRFNCNSSRYNLCVITNFGWLPLCHFQPLFRLFNRFVFNLDLRFNIPYF